MDEKAKERIREYKLAAEIYTEMSDELGKENALKIVRRVLDKRQIKAADELKETLGGNSFELLAEYYHRKASDNKNLKILEITDKQIACKITRCESAEAFKALGCPEICQEYCDTDFDYIKAFNPKMKLIRTKTIAGGDDYCDHIWVFED